MKYFFIILFLFILKTDISAQYIELVNDRFILNGKEFVPVGVNLGIKYYKINDTLTYSLRPELCKNENCGTTKEEIKNNFISTLQDIKNQGYNTIRLVGLALNRDYFTGKLSYKISGSKGDEKTKVIENQDYTETINAIEDAIKVIEEVGGLKVILLVGGHGVDAVDTRDQLTNFLYQLNERLDKYTCIFAYDLYNEPPFFTVRYDYPKCEIHEMTKQWHNALKGNHLTTIGLFDILDVPQFDPNIVDVDFINFHIYGYMLEWNNYSFDTALAVNARTYKWISNNVEKPWILGELGFPGSDYQTSSNPCIGTEEEQKKFAEFSLNASKYNGCLGVVWWQLSEVNWYDLDTDGPKARNNCYGIRYSFYNDVPADKEFTWKKAADVLPDFPTLENPEFSSDDDTYYNLYGFSGTPVKGIITDTSGNPIKDALIDASWYVVEQDTSYYRTNKTFSHDDGYFEVNSPDEGTSYLNKIKVTATKYETINLKGDDLDNDFFNIKLSKVQCIEDGGISNLYVFPNPATDYLKIYLPSEDIESIEIYSLRGEIINLNDFVYQISKRNFYIDVNRLASGLYLLKINTNNQVITKIIAIK